jgi:hypothetical protein
LRFARTIIFESTQLIDLQRHRRSIEIGFWLIYLAINSIVDSLSVITEYAHSDRPLDNWEPFVWELSSAMLTGLLIVAIGRLNQVWRFTVAAWRMPLLIHLLATIPFSVMHVGGMVGLRKLVYAFMGRSYDFGNLAIELQYEFRRRLHDSIYETGRWLRRVAAGVSELLCGLGQSAFVVRIPHSGPLVLVARASAPQSESLLELESVRAWDHSFLSTDSFTASASCGPL